MITTCASVGALPEGDQLLLTRQSPNYREGRFVNSMPVSDPQFFKTLKEWVKGGEHTNPEQPLPVVQRTKSDFDTTPASGLRITWLGHSTTLVEIDGVRLLLDPVWSCRTSPFSWAGPQRFFAPPIPLADLPEIDGVLISHDHYDHLDRETVEQLAPRGVRFTVPLGVGARLKGWGVPPSQIVELDWWQSTTIGSVTVTATPARHFSGRSLVMADRDKTLWAGFAMVGPNRRVYYSGDTGMFDGFREIGQRLGPFDATLIEVGAYHQLWADVHLGPEQAVKAVTMARGGLMIPVHWATFDLALHSWIEPAERLLVAAREATVSLSIPQPGQSIDPTAPLPINRWWPELPWQTAEEHPVVSSRP